MNRQRRLLQLRAVVMLELRRLLRGRDGLTALLFGVIPLVLMTLVVTIRRMPAPAGRVEHDFAVVFQNLVVQVTLYLGCVYVFGGLMRGEQIAKTLHFLFLSPVRRDLLVLGKYLAGLLLTSAVFGGFTVLSYLVLLYGQGAGEATALQGPGVAGHAAAYFLVSALGCAGYGAVFLVLGQWVKNPIVPAIAIWGWEHINFVLPEVLKRLGLIHYLLSLSPVTVSEGFLAVIGEPVPVWVAVPAPLVMAAALLMLAAWKARRMEVDYGVE